ncbi:hypothetical protein NZD89_09405 [Alicyclobacillus fastidiosus]|uniref:Uncharacterized protein n=1 Tax=Alicyclobacillus fastidiosus TaxID=392011 RepID=A0ABY6ZKW6_9BACL|nr:hypothetical protein [Alicyclobacillus fastidiosus]WAH43573.1 hypothetical protein NZD89_09405 [Alicyclobacillus fastidiosus]GMA59751.1 hypothetical protein GCM10025859_01910 [Alicyclobacillus fastidiosus]
MFNLNDIYTAAIAIGGSGVVTALIHKAFSPKVVAVEQKVVQDAGTLKPFLADGIHAVEDLLKLPELAGVKAKLDHAEVELQNTKLVLLAGQVLHATGKRLDALTSNQKTGIALVVSTEAAKAGLPVTQASVLAALNTADKAVDAIGSLPLFQSTKEIDAPAPAQQEQTSPVSDGQATATAVS